MLVGAGRIEAEAERHTQPTPQQAVLASTGTAGTSRSTRSGQSSIEAFSKPDIHQHCSDVAGHTRLFHSVDHAMQATQVAASYLPPLHRLP